MGKFKCDICDNSFKNKYSLKKHQKTAKYCLKLKIETFNCESCKSLFQTNNLLNVHEQICIKYIKNQIKIDYEKLIDSKNTEIQSLKEQVQDLQNKLENIAIEATKRPTTINATNNNQRISHIINNLQPLTDEHLREQAQYLTLEHVKNGAEGYAKYALEYPLKNRVVCVDFSRRKLKYKNADGELITDPEMSKISQKLFRAIEDRNQILIAEYTDQLKNKLTNSGGSDNLTKTEVDLLNVQTDAIIDDMTNMAHQRGELREVSQGLKPEIYHNFVRNVCSRAV